MFDCVMPTRNARHGIIFSMSRINIRNLKYKYDLSLTLDPNINSPISKYSKSYIRHLYKTNEILGIRIRFYITKFTLFKMASKRN